MKENNKMRYFTWLLFFPTLINAQIKPLLNAHAHNDYEHDRPLLDALEHGFTSIEADVHLIDGELYVYHDRPERPDSQLTLEKLYLQPLMERIKKNKGKVYQSYQNSIFLMIDIKTEAKATYEVLKKKLKRYRSMLSYSKGEKLYQGAVTIFLSGNRPMETVLEEKKRLVGIDGRPANLGEGYTMAFMPVISDRYSRHFQWRGFEDRMPEEELVRLRKLVQQAHAEDKKLRLWASPEREVVWETLLNEGVDLINTDELKKLRDFLLQQ